MIDKRYFAAGFAMLLKKKTLIDEIIDSYKKLLLDAVNNNSNKG